LRQDKRNKKIINKGIARFRILTVVTKKTICHLGCDALLLDRYQCFRVICVRVEYLAKLTQNCTDRGQGRIGTGALSEPVGVMRAM
jgi:hypothetical protein